MNTTIKTILTSLLVSLVVAFLVVGLTSSKAIPSLGAQIQNDQFWFTGGIKVGNSVNASTINQILTNTKSWYPGAVNNVSYATTTLAVTGAVVGNTCLTSLTTMINPNLSIDCSVISANTVAVQITNPSATTSTVATGTLAIKVFQ